MRLKDLHSNDKELIVSALRVQADAFRAMQAQVEENDTTLPRLINNLRDAQNAIGRLEVTVTGLAAQEVPH